MINWINGFDAGNKKEKYSLTLRLGTFTVIEIKVDWKEFRFMLFNPRTQFDFSRSSSLPIPFLTRSSALLSASPKIL